MDEIWHGSVAGNSAYERSGAADLPLSVQAYFVTRPGPRSAPLPLTPFSARSAQRSRALVARFLNFSSVILLRFVLNYPRDV